MRVRNPQTGTVVSVGEETGGRLVGAGWFRADESKPRESTRESRADEPTEADESKSRRRRASR